MIPRNKPKNIRTKATTNSKKPISKLPSSFTRRPSVSALPHSLTPSPDCNDQEPAFFTNRAIAYLKCQQFDEAKRDCQQALNIDPKFAKAFNRLSKCYIALGNLYEASISLQKSIELDPSNKQNKVDQKHLADLKITDSLIVKFLKEEMWEKCVTNLTALLADCVLSVDRICLKIECLCRAFDFAQANNFSAACMKRSELVNNPKMLLWRGKVLIYTGADIVGKKHFT